MEFTLVMTSPPPNTHTLHPHTRLEHTYSFYIRGYVMLWATKWLSPFYSGGPRCHPRIFRCPSPCLWPLGPFAFRFRSISVVQSFDSSPASFPPVSPFSRPGRDRTTFPTFVFTFRISELSKPSSFSTSVAINPQSEIDRFEPRICAGYPISISKYLLPSLTSLPIPKPLDS